MAAAQMTASDFIVELIFLLVGTLADAVLLLLRPRGYKWAVGIVAGLLLSVLLGSGAYRVGRHTCLTSLSASRFHVLSEDAELYDFADGDKRGWRPLEWDRGWTGFERSGELEVADSSVILAGYTGPFLRYPLDLESPGQWDYRRRNAIYLPVDSTLIGVIANVEGRA